MDFVPEGNERPVVIDVRAGTYHEIDYVRADRPHLTGRPAPIPYVAGEERIPGGTHP
ncbi:hypothetical protein [Actinoallomurus sp. NPDC052274]|uniref:hypothetical protein n=1 Tax=Actinoallomurus sp. NPDC052274 TaxID=3155420 RepID=UPI00343C0D7E